MIPSAMTLLVLSLAQLENQPASIADATDVGGGPGMVYCMPCWIPPQGGTPGVRWGAPSALPVEGPAVELRVPQLLESPCGRREVSIVRTAIHDRGVEPVGPCSETRSYHFIQRRWLMAGRAIPLEFPS